MLERHVNQFLEGFPRREEGQTLAEYALILALIAVAAIAAVTLLGTQIAALLTKLSSSIK